MTSNVTTGIRLPQLSCRACGHVDAFDETSAQNVVDAPRQAIRTVFGRLLAGELVAAEPERVDLDVDLARR